MRFYRCIAQIESACLRRGLQQTSKKYRMSRANAPCDWALKSRRRKTVLTEPLQLVIRHISKQTHGHH